jgi:hypothetical protein
LEALKEIDIIMENMKSDQHIVFDLILEPIPIAKLQIDDMEINGKVIQISPHTISVLTGDSNKIVKGRTILVTVYPNHGHEGYLIEGVISNDNIDNDKYISIKVIKCVNKNISIKALFKRIIWRL